MNVDEYAVELRAPELEFVQDGTYANALGRVGYRALYRKADKYIWFSISSTETPLAPDEVAMAITARTRWVQRENPYSNRKGAVAFEATVLSDGHAFMLGASSRPPKYF